MQQTLCIRQSDAGVSPASDSLMERLLHPLSDRVSPASTVGCRESPASDSRMQSVSSIRQSDSSRLLYQTADSRGIFCIRQSDAESILHQTGGWQESLCIRQFYAGDTLHPDSLDAGVSLNQTVGCRRHSCIRQSDAESLSITQLAYAGDSSIRQSDSSRLSASDSLEAGEFLHQTV